MSTSGHTFTNEGDARADRRRLIDAGFSVSMIAYDPERGRYVFDVHIPERRPVPISGRGVSSQAGLASLAAGAIWQTATPGAIPGPGSDAGVQGAERGPR